MSNIIDPKKWEDKCIFCGGKLEETAAHAGSSIFDGIGQDFKCIDCGKEFGLDWIMVLDAVFVIDDDVE